MQIFLLIARTARRFRSLTNASKYRLQLLSIFSLLAAAPQLHAAQAVLLSWDPSPDPTVAGYNVYYGTSSVNYTRIVSAGPSLQAVVTNLSSGVTYYFAVTALDLFGQESVFSNEVTYTPPRPAGPKCAIALASGGTASIAGIGVPGHVYELQATTNFSSWTVIGTRTAGSNGAFSVSIPVGGYPSRYFRFRDTAP